VLLIVFAGAFLIKINVFDVYPKAIKESQAKHNVSANHRMQLQEKEGVIVLPKEGVTVLLQENVKNVSIVQDNVQQKSTAINTKKKAKEDYIKLLPKKGKIYFSAFPDFGGTEDVVSKKRITQFENLIGRKIFWAPFSQNWGRGMKYPKKEIDAIYSAGVIPLVRFMPRTTFDENCSDQSFSLEKIIAGNFDVELHKWAQAAKKDGRMILIEFAVEPNGNWFPWSGVCHNNNPKIYRDAYQHIINLFHNDGVHNVTWFFHADINSMPNTSWNKIENYYPGDDYIDWIGVSSYGPQNEAEDYWEDLEDLFQENKENLKNLIHRKPFAIMEFGVTDKNPRGDKAQWIYKAFQFIRSGAVPIRAVNYWHENWEERDNVYALLRVDSSSKSLDAFTEEVHSSIFYPLIKDKEKETRNKNIIFKSGFEKSVLLEQSLPDDGGIWWQEIKGSDEMGYQWPIYIEGEGSLQLIVDFNKDITQYITNVIERVRDKNGDWTHALHQIISRKQREDTQDPYIVYTEGNEVKDLYIKYAMKLPKNTKELLGKDGWMAITEFKTTSDYRLAFYIYEDKSGTLYWYVHGDNVVIDGVPYNEFWYRENYDVSVPLGVWFDIELFWHRSTKNNGRVWWAINGETIVDYHGQTKVHDPINAIMVFTNYASGPMHQWIDDIVVAHTFPCGEGKSCMKNREEEKIQTKIEKKVPCIYNNAYIENGVVDSIATIINKARDCYVLLEPENDTSAEQAISDIKKKGNTVGCYTSIGTVEQWRKDFNDFEPYRANRQWQEWEGEYFLRNINKKVFSLMKKHFDYFARIGCDYVEFDNMDWVDDEHIRDYDLSVNELEAKKYAHDLCEYTHQKGMKCMAKSTNFDDSIFDGLTLESYPDDKNWWAENEVKGTLWHNGLAVIVHYDEQYCDKVHDFYKQKYGEKISFLCAKKDTGKYLH